MALFKEEEKDKKKLTKETILGLLNEGDKDIPVNPGEFDLLEKNDEFSHLFENSVGACNVKVGDIVRGRIITMKKDFVIVDINYKSEGIISKSEFRLVKGQDELQIGQEVEVYVDSIENENGMMVLSKNKADIHKAWKDIIKAKENNDTIKGTVVSQVKGGLSVDIGVSAFLPGSQLDIHPVRNMKPYIGQTYDFKVINVNQKRGNIVLSRRVILEKDKAEGKAGEAPDGLKEGDVLKGIVKNITEYGAFVDLGSRDGLLHITDMSWSRLNHPSDLLSMGQEIEVKILKFDMEKNRISLGMKQLNEREWQEAVKQYPVGSIVKGKIVSLVDYGAFVLLDKGLEGLVHLNEISWTRKVKNPSPILQAGQEIEVKVIDIQREAHKLSLSIKQAQENPWNKIKEKYSVGQDLEVPIVSISDFGIFVNLEDGIDGLVHVSDLSWSEMIKPAEKYKVGEKLNVKILDINPEEEKLSLSVKHLQANPWDSVEGDYPIGSRHEVQIVRIVNFGVFVKLHDKIEGLIHLSELSQKRIQNPRDHFKVGDKVTAEILTIDSDSKKISLSIRLVESGKSDSSDTRKNEFSGNVRDQIKKTNKKGFMDNFFAKTLKASLTKKEEDSSQDRE